MIEYRKNLSLENLFYVNEKGLVCVEEFRDIPGYEGLYQVSNLGRVKSFSKLVKRRFGFFETKNKILKPALDMRGYYFVTFYLNKKSKMYRLHQLVAIVFLNHNLCGYEKVVNHKNFIKTDNRLENLEIVTNRENTSQKHILSTSKYIGVCWDKKAKKWKSSIRFKGKLIYLGVFNSEIEASEYYQNALLAIQNGSEIKRNLIKKPL